jgi:hypothetical protein
MSKHIIKGFVFFEQDASLKDCEWYRPCVGFSMYAPNPELYPDRVLVHEHEFEVEVPDDFNPIPQQVAALEEQKRLMRVKLADELAKIDEKISKLTCIEHTVEAA